MDVAGCPVAAFGASLALLFVPFLVADRAALAYSLLGIHESAGAGTAYRFGIVNKAMVVLALCRDNQLLALATIVALAVLGRALVRERLAALRDDAEVWFLWALTAAIGAANFAANWVHAEYHTIQVPVLAAAIGATVPRILALSRDPRGRRALAALSVTGAFLQPLAFGRTEIWTRDARIASPYAHELVSYLRDHAGAGEPVLATNPAFAIEAGRPLLRGSEGFPFTYTPAWSPEECRRRVSLDDQLLVEAFRDRVPAVVALVRDQFRVGSPGFVVRPAGADQAVWDALDATYRLAARFPNPDATPNDILVYVRR
ncbi:MAG: hypothetical protein U0166_02115 [Acidobacteriota bacterium]